GSAPGGEVGDLVDPEAEGVGVEVGGLFGVCDEDADMVHVDETEGVDGVGRGGGAAGHGSHGTASVWISLSTRETGGDDFGPAVRPEYMGKDPPIEMAYPGGKGGVLPPLGDVWVRP